jgi:hypothetical protein
MHIVSSQPSVEFKMQNCIVQLRHSAVYSELSLPIGFAITNRKPINENLI